MDNFIQTSRKPSSPTRRMKRSSEQTLLTFVRKPRVINPRLFIIDTSVVIKWFSLENEKNIKESLDVLIRIKKGEITVFSPDFLLIETANIAYKKKHLKSVRIKEIINRLKGCGIKFVEFERGETDKLLEIMEKYKTTAYDGLYLLLAKEKKCKLLTFDDELLRIKNLTVGIDNVVRD